MTTASDAANEKRPCDLFLESYQALGKVAEFKIALRCESGRKEAFPINEPLLIGLTATTSTERENDRVEIEAIFPRTPCLAGHHGGSADLPRPSQRHFRQDPCLCHGLAAQLPPDCAGGRSGCAKFGYALAMPTSAAKTCMKKDEYGEMTVIDDLMCKGSTDYRFKFR